MHRRKLHQSPYQAQVVQTPWGQAVLLATPRGLQSLRFFGSVQRTPTQEAPTAPQEHLVQAAVELSAYAARTVRAFSVTLDFDDATAFQRSVWLASVQIPYGETRSYRWIAERIGHPGAARAVGNALHVNPLPLFIPCHRVVSSTGSLGGFAYGLELKQHLLLHERN